MRISKTRVAALHSDIADSFLLSTTVHPSRDLVRRLCTMSNRLAQEKKQLSTDDKLCVLTVEGFSCLDLLLRDEFIMFAPDSNRWFTRCEQELLVQLDLSAIHRLSFSEHKAIKFLRFTIENCQLSLGSCEQFKDLYLQQVQPTLLKE